MPMNGNKPTEQQALQERQKFVTAFNDIGIAQGVTAAGRWSFLRGGIVPVLPRIRLVAGLWHGPRNAPWQ